MKKIFNYRPLVFIALNCACIIIGITGWFQGKILIGTIMASLGLLVAVTSAICSRKLCSLFIILFFMSLIGLDTFIVLLGYQNEYHQGDVTITLTDNIEIHNDTLYAVGKSIILKDKKLKGNVLVYIDLDSESYLENLREGDKLVIYEAKLIPGQLFNDYGISSSNYRLGIKYKISTQEFNVRRISGEPGALSKARYKIKETLYSKLDGDAAAVSYAMITGNRSYISAEINDSYTAAGLTHILAVSGLNVSFIVGVISFIIMKIRGSRFVKFSLLSVFILMYAALCGFNSSVLRASIMGIVMVFGKLFGKKYDALCSLGFAAIVILFIFPLYIFDLSFLLSFMAVFSIICLYPQISKIYKKRVKNKFTMLMLDTLNLTLVANIGVLPIMAHYFNSISPYTLFTNLVALPFVNIAFFILAVGCLLGIFIPSLAFTVIPAGWIFGALNAFAGWIMKLQYSTIIIFSLGAGTILYFFAIIFFGNYLNINQKPKRILATALVAISAIVFINSNLSVNACCDKLVLIDAKYNMVSVVMVSGDTFVVGKLDDYNYYDVRDYLIDNKIRKIKGIILTHTPDNTQGIKKLYREFNAEKLAVATNNYEYCDELSLSDIKIQQIFGDIEYDFFGLGIYCHEIEKKLVGMQLDYNEKSIMYPMSESAAAVEYLNELVEIDITVSHDYLATHDLDIEASSRGFLFISKENDYIRPNNYNVTKYNILL